MSNKLDAEQSISFLSGSNANYVEDMYEAYLADPQAVSAEWRNYFSALPQVKGNASQDVPHSQIRDYFLNLAQHRQPLVSGDAAHAHKQNSVDKLIAAYRSFGHLIATIDPLNLRKIPQAPQLELNFYNLTDADLASEFVAGSMSLSKQSSKTSLKQILSNLRKTYCGNIGFEYAYISKLEELEWLQQRIETSREVFSAEQKKNILTQLARAEGLEKYLGTRYVGQTRFSLEGGESLIPLLDEVIQSASDDGANETVIGMGHRGRLSVLVNTIGKSSQSLFQEFESKNIDPQLSGDVKYHIGYSSDVEARGGHVHLSLLFNPSHLEVISAVVEGSVRARQERRPETDHHQVLPIAIHGDAAFAGQGIVMETLNMSQTRGFTTCGTIHIVVNNQIGFTTSNPQDARSTLYCSDIAKMIEAPVLHVNADDPEAVVFAAQLAVDYRMRFKKDVVIDLVCYRRYGHNEADDPSITQPGMYQIIKQHPTTYKMYADKLINQSVCTQEDVNKITDDYRASLDKGEAIIKTVSSKQFTIDWTPYLKQDWRSVVSTAVPLKRIEELGERLNVLPENFAVQPQVARELQARYKMSRGETPMNWGCAEIMAYASLVAEGYPIRLSGQDAGRGTFTHRHAVLHDFKTDDCYIPLRQIDDKQAPFYVIDSLLSEYAVMGFEYGYAASAPTALVIWEAQYGDFANGAQVIIDQFISSGENKWGRLNGLVLFLPHGYEGAGPEHSSARLERFLQLCAQQNMQVCVPSTPAQVFHMLRRQVLRPFRKPLVVMTPKSLLRHKLAVSTLDDLTKGQFQLVIPEIDEIKMNEVTRVILCSGKVYYDLLDNRRKNNIDNVAILRVEQLYPFPEEEITAQLARYKKAHDIVWCQEEPKNQGAWYVIQSRLIECLTKSQQLRYIGREASASPAAGGPYLHQKQQALFVEQAFASEVMA